jgi:hypothetical protein
VQVLELSRGDETFGNAALICYYDHREAGLSEFGDAFNRAREKLNVFPSKDVVSFGRVPIDDSVSIQERCFDQCRNLLAQDSAARLGSLGS